MWIIAAIVAILLTILASVDLFLAQYNPDELSSMGIDHK
jgi:hypothetical protein